MADNIKIIGNVNDTQRVSRFKDEDVNLLGYSIINQSFGFPEDYIEFFVSDNGGVVNSNYDYRNFKNPSDSPLNPNATLPVIEIDPIQDLQNLGYTSGIYNTQYNFFKKKISDFNAELFISELSGDRTELRINSNIIPTNELITSAQNLITELDNSLYQKYFLLNFLNGYQAVALNVAVDSTTSVPTVLFKLYEPLPPTVGLKDQLWVVEEIVEPYIFDINLDVLVSLPASPTLRRPNFDIDVDIKKIVPTGYETYSSLVSSLTGSSYHNVLNYMNDESYDLNIDYTDFSNFIHFSSAEKRLEIFKYKLDLINSYNSSIDSIILSNNSPLRFQETSSLKSKINDVITNFDGYEHYLYFESGSSAWPKTGNIKPYTNRSIGKTFYQPFTSSVWTFTHSLNETPSNITAFSSSGAVILPTSSITNSTLVLSFNFSCSGYVTLNSPSAVSFYNASTSSATSYDDENLDRLYNIIPTYVKNDPDNYQQYYTFVDMIGHYFDNVWIYINSINELHNADNNLEKGISKDIVYDALKSLGVKVYNSKGDFGFDDYIGGLNSGSSTFVNDFSVTSSFLNNIPKKDLIAELYKRIYHNLPLINKTKGTATGLQNIITSFGITGSILSPKEFGGNTNTMQLSGYNNDKITVYNNIITGSILSPFVSVQMTPTSSNEFISTDLHFVDLSFSPQNQVNTRISASIATTYPTFSLDDYIGDPRLLESASYASLDSQRRQFISASAAVSGSAKRLDYKGFFELVKYFDNSLFKMLKDFVPARANALTGVTIQSPILERNKIQSFKPKFTEQTIYDAEYSGPTITEDITYHYNKIGDKKFPFYTGEVTGSYINVYDSFENTLPNTYLFSTGSIDIHKFNHSDFNVTLNNVTNNVRSKFRFKIEDIYGSSQQVLRSGAQISSSIELQDSYDTLRGHQNSRYLGSKLKSLKYNVYTSRSFGVYNGDIAYAKTAAIDKFSNYIGLFSQIKESSFLVSPQKNNVSVKYLVDRDGNLTELNEKNKHWVDVQGIFKSGENGIVSLFDSQKYSNQKSTNGTKAIYNSGYNYYPTLYNSTNDKLYFKYSPSATLVAKQFKITTVGGYIKGSTPIKYPITSNNVYGLFGKSIDSPDLTFSGISNYNNTGTSPVTFSSYTIDSTGPQQFSTAFSIGLNVPGSGTTVAYTYSVKKNGSLLASQSLSYTSQKTTIEYTYSNYNRYIIKSGSYTLPETVTVIDGNTGEIKAPLPSGSSWYKIIAYDSIITTIVGGSEVISGVNPITWFMSGTDYNGLLTSVPVGTIDGYYVYDVRTDYKEYTQYTEIATDTTLANKLNFNLTTNFQSFAANDVISFELTENIYNPINYTASISPGGILSNQQVVNMKGTFPYISNSYVPFIYGSVNGNTLILSSDLSSVQGYQFVPNVKGNESTLFTTYKNVDIEFNPKAGDVIVLYYTTTANNSSQQKVFESPIKNVYKDYYGKIHLLLTTTLPSTLAVPTYFSSTLDSFIITSRINDESNILLTYDKNPGETSLGFIIPENVNPDLLSNIDVITKEVKQKLIDLGMFDGGTF
jgi:hypothetical protein